MACLTEIEVIRMNEWEDNARSRISHMQGSALFHYISIGISFF
jgi:hypothetical protein